MDSDFTIRESPKQVLLAFAACLLIHLLLLSGFGLWLRRERVPKPPEDSKPMRVVLRRPAPPVSVVPQLIPMPRPEKLAVEVPDLPSEKDKPKNPLVEADRNLRAASEDAADGNAPLPSQKGRDERFIQLQQQAYRAGSDGASQPSSQPSKPTPIQQPKPTTPAETSPQTPQPAQAAPTPVPKPAATPQPKTAPKRQEVAMLRPAASPVPPPLATPLPSPPTPIRRAEQANPNLPPQQQTPPVPQTQPSRSAYRAESSKTRISGNISNRGRASVDAEATPLGRYQRIVRDAIGSRWNMYTRSRIDLITLGTARIKFQITESGKVENLKVVENSSNEIFATCTIQAVLDAEIPAIPPDVAASLESRQLEVDYTFNIYAN